MASFFRGLRRGFLVCVIVAVLLASAFVNRAAAVRAARTTYPPAMKAESRPLSVVYLHGMHGRAANGCPWFRGGASEQGWLVCPEAIEEQPDGSWSWGADVFKQAPIVEGALRAARANGASSEPGIAVGFSQGSYVALDLVKARLAKFRGRRGRHAHRARRRPVRSRRPRVARGRGALVTPTPSRTRAS
jgi:hypothetical protein